QQRGREHLALSVGLEGNRAAAVQRAVQQEVQRPEVRQLVALDVPFDHPLEMACDSGGGHLLHQNGIVLGPVRDEPDVRRIALVSGPRMRQLEERHPLPTPPAPPAPPPPPGTTTSPPPRP